MSIFKDFLTKNGTPIKAKAQKPKRYAVVIHNDDTTPMDFVVHILGQCFHKSHDEAMLIMLKSHHNDRAIIEVYSKEIAEQKVTEILLFARKNNFPLLATFEEYH